MDPNQQMNGGGMVMYESYPQGQQNAVSNSRTCLYRT